MDNNFVKVIKLKVLNCTLHSAWVHANLRINFWFSCENDIVFPFFPVSVTLQFTYVETYPDDPPTIEVSTYEGIDYTDVEKLQEFLEQEVN